jgi:triosephosphate isomerase
MLRDAGCTDVILGHSERRTDHGETDAQVRAKTESARRAGLRAIVCVGERLSERTAGSTLDSVGHQLEGSLPGAATAANLTVAYEPVWAIGTGLTPTSDDIVGVHAFIRQRLRDRFGPAGEDMHILYGGSVKPANAKELLLLPDVNGALIGGASLKAEDFLAIASAYA